MMLRIAVLILAIGAVLGPITDIRQSDRIEALEARCMAEVKP